ncbi:MAG: hypothetical protein JG764_1366 [Clostridiales bacterium]|jgi:hypothetical protein|nr:hypothetical protein [Clostridiales bacterium]
MSERSVRYGDFVYWGLLLAVSAPVLILGVFLVLLLTLPGANLPAGGFSVLIIAKAVFYGGGVLLILLGNIVRKNYIATILALLAFMAVFFQLFPPQISPSGMDVVLGLPGLALVLLALAVWLPDFQNRNCYCCLAFGILCGLVVAYQLFEVLALVFLPYALPSFLESHSWLNIFEIWGNWIVYFSLIFKLLKGWTYQNESLTFSGLYFKPFLGITALAIVFAMLLMTGLFMQLEKGLATVEYVIQPTGNVDKLDILLPVAQFKDEGEVIAANDFIALYAERKERLNAKIEFVQTEYGTMLHFIHNEPVKDKVVIRGQLESQNLGWYLGREEVPVVLSPRVIDEDWTRATELPVVPEHNALYTVVNCKSGGGAVSLSYCLELVVKGVKPSAYQQVFTAYLPFNYLEGFKIKEGWQLVPMIEEILVREM